MPYIEAKNSSAVFEHEATTSKISEDMLFYCRQRGLSAEEAAALVVNGFVKDVLQQLPMEFAVEAQKLISISLEGCGRMSEPVERADVGAGQGGRGVRSQARQGRRRAARRAMQAAERVPEGVLRRRHRAVEDAEGSRACRRRSMARASCCSEPEAGRLRGRHDDRGRRAGRDRRERHARSVRSTPADKDAEEDRS